MQSQIQVLAHLLALTAVLRADLDCMIFPYDCSMGLAHVLFKTRIVSSKPDLLYFHDSRTQHEKCRRILKHVLKPYNSCSHSQNVRMMSCVTRAASAT